MRGDKIIELNKIYNEDCLEGMKRIPDKSISCVITSPPYAEQRKFQYGGIPEEYYPQWTVNWCELLKNKLKDDGSVFINIRPHIINGEISDYVLKTRLALRDNGWIECEELIWIKPNSPPLGSINRPRRAWESILWFSKTNKIKCYPKSNGCPSNRLGFEANKFEQGGKSHIHAGQNKAKIGVARSRDYIEVGTGKVEKGLKHPAMYPCEIPEYLIKLTTDENDNVLDPFIGSGTTAIACLNTNRNYIGFEIDKGYFDIAEKRVKEHKST